MIPIKGPVPTRLAVFNGLGSVAYGIKDNGFSTFLLLFYNQVLGMDARLVSLALLIALVFDGLIDPVVGHISDRLDTRWGRRLPFLYLAPIPLGLFWVLLWSPVGPPSFAVLLFSAIGQHRWVAVRPPKVVHKGGLGGAFRDIRECLGHPAFLVLMAALAAAITSQGITFSISNYLYLFVWQFPPLALQLYPILLFFSVIGSFVLVGPLHKRWGKRETAVYTGLLGMIFWVVPLTLRNFGLWAPDGSTASLVGMFAFTFLSNLCSVITGISLWSMVADVVEASEEQTGRRAEGTFAAGAFFASKCSTGLGIFATGFLLSLSGMPNGAKPGQVDPAVVDRMAMAYVGCVVALAILLVFIIRRFPIDRRAHEARLAALDAAARLDPEATGLHP